MPTSDPRSRGQSGIFSADDSRWQEIWRLVLDAEQKPVADRRSFLLSAQVDSSVIRQAIAILEGSATLASAAPSFPAVDDGRFAPRTGMRIGRYRVGTLLGSGGTSFVYAAFDQELNRAVAIKFFSPRRHGTPASAARPLREARAASALNHPNIIMIHEVIETGEGAAIVMELVQGVTLRAIAAERPRLDDVLHWCRQLAHALAVAHAHDLIHGDIKPENVMVREDGYVKLLDFGLALGARPEERTAVPLTGTLRYLSPEQCLGQPPTPASDVFAFGVLLYELTTDQYPFPTDSTMGLLQAIAAADALRPSCLNPKLPCALDDLIAGMLANQPAARPTAQQVADRLAEAARQVAANDRRRSSKVQLWALAAALALLTSVVTILPVRQPRGRIDLSRMAIRPMASQPGLETHPAISSDGRWISCQYRVRTGDLPQLQVHSTQGDPPVVINTAGLVVEDRKSTRLNSSHLGISYA